MGFLRAQASIELISILAVSLLVLGVLMATSRSAYEDMQQTLDSRLAENSLRMLAYNAENAYRDGAGSIRKTILRIPNTAVPEESYIEDNIINIRLEHKYGVRDMPQPFSVPVRGTLNFNPGDYEVYAVSHNGYVYLTESPSLLAEPAILYVNANKGETAAVSIEISNPGYNDATITASLSPQPSGLDIALGWNSMNIAAGETKQLDMQIYSDQSAQYTGNLTLRSETGEYEKIYVNAKVS